MHDNNNDDDDVQNDDESGAGGHGDGDNIDEENKSYLKENSSRVLDCAGKCLDDTFLANKSHDNVIPCK